MSTEQQPVEVKSTTPAKLAGKEIDSYRTAVDEMLTKKISMEISNGLPQHAAVLFEQFFKHAKKSVLIFCETLSESVFDSPEIVEKAKIALKNGVSIKVIIQADQPNNSAFLTFLKENKDDPNLSLKKATAREWKEHPANFATMDGTAFRFEKNRDHIVAVANTNLPAIASILEDRFYAADKTALAIG